MSDEVSKLIFAGLDKAGKTTIYKATMEEMSLSELQESRPTRGIERHAHDFLDRDFSVWDLGGQQNYRETYLSKPEVFNQTKALIFVVDIQDIDRLDEAYQYYLDIINILNQLAEMPKLYVLFHKFDPDKIGKLRTHFYRATKMFRQADELIRQKFKGYATSIFSNSIDLAVKRILFENFENYQEPTGKVKLKSTTTEKEDVKEVPSIDKSGAAPSPSIKKDADVPMPSAPKPGISSAPTPSAPKPEVTSAPTPSAPKPEVTSTPTPAEPKTEVKEVPKLTAEEEKELDKALEEATPTSLIEFSEEVINQLTNTIETRMKESPEIVALSILSSDGSQALAVGKSEIDYERLETLKNVVEQLNPKQFFKYLTDIEYRGLGHFSLSDFDIYFARASDSYAIAVIAVDVSTMMLQNAQRIVRSIRQGLGLVPPDQSDEDSTGKPKKKKDLVTDLRGRLKSITGLSDLDS
ncbi:MAG: ADP-ribosylation factor-like protein [Candidatus Heimdallarchaeota archaeon]|nr:ADP-ribosylation factor-like protein [Candidatus Heimdallarchaeota archaeon]